MLEKIKKISTITKIFYLFALILFIAWVVPSISSYYGNVKTYKKSNAEIESLTSKYNIAIQEEKFSEASFIKDTKLLFSKVTIKPFGENKYSVMIKMKLEDLKKFYNFVETISLRYPVKLKDDLKITVNDDIITINMQLIAF